MKDRKVKAQRSEKHRKIVRITERRRMEEEAGKARQFMETILENANVWFNVLDENANVMAWNKAAELMSGYTREEVVGHSKIWEWLYPDEEYRKSITDAVADVMRRGRFDQDLETRILRKDGEVRIISWNQRNLLDEHGKVTGSIAFGRDITERKKMEEALRESQQSLEAIVETAGSLIVLTDPDGRIVLFNRACEDLTGYKRDEVFGKTIPELFLPPEWVPVVQKRFADPYAPEVRAPHENPWRTKSGEERIIEWRCTVIPSPEGGRPCILGTGVDVSERKRMEEALSRYSTSLQRLVLERTGKLAQSERRFRELADLLPQIVFEIDDKGNFTFFNRIGFTSTGYTEDDLRRGLNAFQMFVPEDRDRAMQNMLRILRGERLGANEYTVLRKDGTAFPVIIHSSPIVSGDRPIGLRGIAIDITERKRIEEELRAAKERLDYVIVSNPAVIFTGKPHHDLADFDTTYMSSNVALMLGYEPRQFIDDPKFWEEHVLAEDRRRVLSELPKVFKDGHVGYDYRFMHKDRTYRWVHEEIRAVRDEAGNPSEVIGYWTDVTEEKRMEEAFLRSERLAAVGELATMVAHDLRNPLTGIIGASYHLKKKLSSSVDQKSREMLDVIEKDVEYANKILSDLLEYSREIQLELSETTPRSITEQALALVKIPSNIRVSDSTNDHPSLAVDTEKMRRVFANLIKNAVEAMPNGGELTIRSKESNGCLQVAFSDTGTGLAEDVMRRIWTPFFTTKAKGIGLGLSISKRITEAHRGRISLETEVGKGATFTVTIPIEQRLKEVKVHE